MSDISARTTVTSEELREDLTVEDFSDADFEAMGYTQEEKNALFNAIEAVKEEIETVWKQIDEISENLANLTEEELDELYSDIADEDDSRKVIYNSYSVIDRYNLANWYEKRDWENPGGYCGPCCVSFILLGLGKDAKNDLVPLTEDSEKITNLYTAVQNEIGTGPKLFKDLDEGLNKFSPYKLKLCAHYYGTIFDHVKKENLPCISLRSSKGLSSSAIAFHYRVVIGTKTEKVSTILKLFRKKKTLFSWHDHFYYMHDNGTDGKNFYENSKSLYEIGAAKVVKD